MRKWMMCVLTVCLLAVALSVTAFAAETDGIQSVTPTKDGVSVSGQTGEKFTLTYSGAESGKEYLVVVSSDSTKTLNDKTIYYIDQKQADSGVSFQVYPKTLSDGTYYVYLSSNASNGIKALEQVATIEAKGPAYTLGDVDGKNGINSTDAVMTLQHAVKLIKLSDNQLLAADVNKRDGVNSTDAVMILQYAVKLINSFDGK